MMSQDEFVRTREDDWRALEALLQGGRPLHRLPAPEQISRAAALYRAVCADLMRARAAGYEAEVVDRLDGLAARGLAALYRAPAFRAGAVWDLVARDFPRAVRRHGRFFALALILFLAPGLLGFFGSLRSRAFAVQVLPEQAIQQMEEAYAEGFDQGRSEGADTSMAGFYVYNNVGIAFRCFATGALFGLGSVFFLVYNGLSIGAVAGSVAAAGHGRNLFTFIAGHGAFELTAIVIAGAAGLVMGWALVVTGGRTRTGSVRARAGDLAYLMLGAALMLIVAALIEGFWSPSAVPPTIKGIVAAGLYALVMAYFVFAGRPARRRDP